MTPQLITRLKENLEWLAKEMKWFYAGTDSDDGNFYFRWYGRKDCGGMSVAKHLMVVVLKNNEDVIVYWDPKRQFSNSLYRIVFEATDGEHLIMQFSMEDQKWFASTVKIRPDSKGRLWFAGFEEELESTEQLSTDIEGTCLRIEQLRKATK